MKDKLIIIGAVVVVALIIGAYLFVEDTEEKTVLTIFHAGSLSVPFEEIEKIFEEQHPNVDVQRQSGGSSAMIREVTDLDKIADVVASADYTLIDSMMIEDDPQYADWNIRFAKNRLVICYTDESKYKDEITQDNWVEIFSRSDVNFGFSNPNDDPCGYRSVMMFQLSEFHYGNNSIFDDLILNHTDITITDDGYNYSIHTPETLNPDSKVMIRPKSVELMAQLEAGALDYAIEYLSVAKQHEDSGARYLTLSEQIDLSSIDYKDTYSKVSLEQFSNLPDKGKTIIAKPIVYGITVPTNAENVELAIEFIELVISTEGNVVFTNAGQPPISPAETAQINNIPTELLNLVTEV